MNAVGFYLLLSSCFYINLHALYELTQQFQTKTGSAKINGGSTGPPMYRLLGNVISEPFLGVTAEGPEWQHWILCV